MGVQLQLSKEDGPPRHPIRMSSLTHRVIKSVPFTPFAVIFRNCTLLLCCYSLPRLTAEGDFNDGFFQQTEESNQFRQEYEMRKTKQACKSMMFTFTGRLLSLVLHFQDLSSSAHMYLYIHTVLKGLLCFTYQFLQDQGLDIISEGLETLKDLAHDMNEACTDNSIKTVV